jgi:hypothetical protein
MIDARDARHAILHKDPAAYCAHPQIAVAADGDWLVVFNRAPRRPGIILHPPQDPAFHNVTIRSSDRGLSWSVPSAVPAPEFTGTECASLTTLPDGRMLLNQWRFRWLDLPTARSIAERPSRNDGDRTRRLLRFPGELVSGVVRSSELDRFAATIGDPESLITHARADGETVVHLSDDNGRSWSETHRIDTTPYDGGYGMRGACVLANGDLLLPLSDVPNYRIVFVVRSSDGGRSWAWPVEVANAPGKEFEEPSLLRLASGRLLMLLRENRTRRLHRCISDDDGASWSAPVMLPIAGYPPHLLNLPDGRIVCTVGWRAPDFGIRALLSADGGERWDLDGIIRIRGGLPNKDLGYPCTIPDGEGGLFTVYYGQDTDGITCIQATRWRL